MLCVEHKQVLHLPVFLFSNILFNLIVLFNTPNFKCIKLTDERNASIIPLQYSMAINAVFKMVINAVFTMAINAMFTMAINVMFTMAIKLMFTMAINAMFYFGH